MALSEVQLSHDVWLSCVTHALSTETEEVMGLLFGDVKHTRTPWGEELAVAQVWCAAPQLRADRRKDRVETTPEQLAAAAADAESMTAAVGRRTRVIGWYHSHPHITVHPSHVDVRTQAMYQMLDSGFVGIIVSCFNNSNSNSSSNGSGSSNGADHARDVRSSSSATPKVGRVQVIAFQSVARGGTGGDGGIGGHQSDHPQVGSSASAALANSPSGHLEEALRQSQLDVNRGSGDYMEKEIPLRIVPTPDFARLATAPSPAARFAPSPHVGRAGSREPHPLLSSPSASPMGSPQPPALTPASPSAVSRPSPPFLTPNTSTQSSSFASPPPLPPSSSLAPSHTGVGTTGVVRGSGGGWRAPAAEGQPIPTLSQHAYGAAQQAALPAESVPPLSLIGPLAGLPLLPRILFEEEQAAFRSALHQLASHASPAVSASHPTSSNGSSSYSSSSSATALASVHHAAAYQTILCQLIDKCMLPLVAAVSNRLHEVRRAEAAAASATPSSPSSSVGVHSSAAMSSTLSSASMPSSTTSWDDGRAEDRLVRGGHVEVHAQVGVRAAQLSGFADASSASPFPIQEAAAAAPPPVGAAHLAAAHPAVAHTLSQSIAFAQQPHQPQLLGHQLQQSWKVPSGGALTDDEQHVRQLQQLHVRQYQEAHVPYGHPDGPQQRQQQQERQQQIWEQQHLRNEHQQEDQLQQRQQQQPVELQQQRQQKQGRHQSQQQITSHGHITATQSAAPVHTFEDLSHLAFTSAATAAASTASAASAASDDGDYVHVAPAAGVAAAEGFGAAGQGSARTSSGTRGARGRGGDGDRQWSLITGLGRSNKASSSAAAAASSADGSAPQQGRKLKFKSRGDRER